MEYWVFCCRNGCGYELVLMGQFGCLRCSGFGLAGWQFEERVGLKFRQREMVLWTHSSKFMLFGQSKSVVRN